MSKVLDLVMTKLRRKSQYCATPAGCRLVSWQTHTSLLPIGASVLFYMVHCSVWFWCSQINPCKCICFFKAKGEKTTQINIPIRPLDETVKNSSYLGT